MSEVLDFLTHSDKNKTIKGIRALIQITNYSPKRLDLFYQGLTLVDNLHSEKGVMLIVKGTEILPNTMQRLIEISGLNSKTEMEFKVNLTKTFLDNYRRRILKKFKNIINFNSNIHGYEDLYTTCTINFLELLTKLLKSDEMTLLLFKQIVIIKLCKNKNASIFLNHTYSTVLFAFGITRTKAFKDKFEFSEKDKLNTLTAAFFHNYGALLNSDNILLEKGEKVQQIYHKSNHESDILIEDYEIDSDIGNAIRKTNDYFHDKINIITKEENKSDIIANILITAIQFNQYVTGLFVDKLELSKNLDNLNVMAVNEKINKTMVQSITTASKFMDMFDFYEELEMLSGLCDTKSSRPYPMTGFNSPTLFVCRDHKNICKYFESSLKAVNIVTPIGDLDQGGYSRCTQATELLLKFYDDHYKKIKTDIFNKDNLTKKKEKI